MFKKIKAQFHKLSLFQKKVFTWVFLQFIYFGGFSLPSLVGRIFGQKFLKSKLSDSSWNTHTDKIDLERMF